MQPAFVSYQLRRDEFPKYLPKLWWLCQCVTHLASLECDSPSLHMSVCVGCVCSSTISPRIMMLVGGQLLGLGPGLGINPTDGGSLGSQLYIWWPAEKLANVIHTHTRTQTHKQQVRTYHTGFCYGSVVARYFWFWGAFVFSSARVCDHSVTSVEALETRGLCVRLIPYMLCHLLLILNPLPPWCKTKWQREPCSFAHSPLTCSPLLLSLFAKYDGECGKAESMYAQSWLTCFQTESISNWLIPLISAWNPQPCFPPKPE